MTSSACRPACHRHSEGHVEDRPLHVVRADLGSRLGPGESAEREDDREREDRSVDHLSCLSVMASRCLLARSSKAMCGRFVGCKLRAPLKWPAKPSCGLEMCRGLRYSPQRLHCEWGRAGYIVR